MSEYLITCITFQRLQRDIAIDQAREVDVLSQTEEERGVWRADSG